MTYALGHNICRFIARWFKKDDDVWMYVNIGYAR